MIRSDTIPSVREPVCLFDMDNTLWDFYATKVSACGRAVAGIGRGDAMDLLYYFLRGLHGFEDYQNIRDYLVDIDLWDEELYRTACQTYEQEKISALEPYEHVPECLEIMTDAGIRMAVVTDADRNHAESRLAKTGLARFFPYVITPDDSGARKPDPVQFRMALDRLGAGPSSAIVIGDSLKREIEPGNRLGMTTVFARYGDWTGIPYPDIVPVHTIDAFVDLMPILGLNNPG